MAAERYGDMAAMMLFREASIGRTFRLTPVRARSRDEQVAVIVDRDGELAVFASRATEAK